MGEPLDRIWTLCRAPQGKRLIKYSAVSAVSVIVGFSVLTLVYGVLRLWSEVPSTLFANIVAGVPSYFLNRQWVWGKSGRSHIWREVVPFWVISVAGIILAILTAAAAHRIVQEHHLHHFAATVLVLGANVCAFGVLWILKFLIFNRVFAELPVAEASVEA